MLQRRFDDAAAGGRQRHVEHDVGACRSENGVEVAADRRCVKAKFGGAPAGALDVDVDQAGHVYAGGLRGLQPLPAHGAAADEHRPNHRDSPPLPAVPGASFAADGGRTPPLRQSPTRAA